MDVKNKTVSTRILKSRYHLALKSGLDSEYILRYTGISEAQVSDDNSRIAYPDYLRFNRFLKQHGFEVLEEGIWKLTIESMLKEHGSMIALCINQPDAGHALDSFLRYRRLIGESDYILCAREGDKVIIQFVGESYASLTDEVLASSALANFIILVNILQYYSDSEIKSYDVHLSHSPMFATEQYHSFFGGEINFNDSGNYLIFDSEKLATPNRNFNPTLVPYLTSQVESELEDLDAMCSFSSLVKGRLLSLDNNLDSGVNSIICEQLGISRWTLRRKLAKEGYTFQSVLAEVRLEKAKHYLLEGRLKLGDISDLLGFSSQSAFSRFFHKQEKVSPIEYRTQNASLFGHEELSED